MDLKSTMENERVLKGILIQAISELEAFAAEKVEHSYFLNVKDTIPFPARCCAQKPKTLTEFRKMTQAEPSHHAVCGLSKELIENSELWELQYILFFVLYCSPALKQTFTIGSPSVVHDMYICRFDSLFESHLSGVTFSEDSSNHGQSVKILPTSALHFTVSQMIRIFSVYNE